ncbi:MAG TPA: biopolymer transporter ExbD [Bacteroidetes bacterium]|nr:biopolymer transporter ExbD [Bacteroidota bacterium]
MGLKRRNKRSSEFSMASLTDVIFLLLIFFVLTSKLVKISPFELPESDSKTVAPVSVVVEIGEDGKYRINGEAKSVRSLESALRSEKSKSGNAKDFTVTIAAYKDIPYEKVVDVIQIAGRLRVRAILATQPTEEGG